jgi:RNA polymerase sigma-70 factor, ECF subfamily
MAVERDAQLMLRVKEGDESSFAELLARYRNPVIHFIYRMVQNRSVAEELAQDVFLRVYRARKAYEPSAKFTTWLFRIATHIALNAIRDSRRERAVGSMDDEEGTIPEVADHRGTIEQNMLENARLSEVRRAVQALPAKQRAAVLMHKYQEMDYAQIAEALDCSESAVKSLLFRAYETLRDRLSHMARVESAAGMETRKESGRLK